MTTVNKKVELGRVWYFTTYLHFPDQETWVKQEPIPGASTTSILSFVSSLDGLPLEAKKKLCRDLEVSWKVPVSRHHPIRGVWFQCVIESTKRRDKWGNIHAERILKRVK